MTNVFRKYPKITNSYDAKFLAHIASAGLYTSGVLWSVSEKLHGANLCIYCDGNGLEIASRNGMLEDSSSFYSLGRIKDELYRVATTLQAYFKQDVKVYGELFGGAYPHPDVAKLSVGMVQKGVFYSPDIHFSVFDIKVNDSFLHVDEMEEVCLAFEILHQDTIFRGTLAECLAFPNDRETGMSDLLDLPPIDDNIMEGVVIKPYIPVFIGDHRVILKNKNDKFKEKNSEKKRVPKPRADLSPEMEDTLNTFDEYINVNRLDSATSKIGEVENRLIGAFMKELYVDIMADAKNDGFNSDFYEKDENKIINKFINEQSKKLIFARIKGEI